MTNNTVRDIRSVLDRLRKAAVQTIDALLDPYGQMLEKAPDAAIGAPRLLNFDEWDSRVGKTADKVFDAGGYATPLFEVERWEQLVVELVRHYENGVYSITTVREWFKKLRGIRVDVLAAIDAALKETDEYVELDFGRGTSAPKAGLEKDILAPEDLVDDLGIGVAAVRKRIRRGNLGPWTREGGRWMILRKDFEAWLSTAAIDIKAGKSVADAKQRADIVRLLERRPRRRSGGGSKQNKS